MKLSPQQSAAIDYIGRHRRTGAKIKPGSRLTRRMFNRLCELHLAMPNGDTAMLTALGEREFSKLHPRSKYRIS